MHSAVTVMAFQSLAEEERLAPDRGIRHGVDVAFVAIAVVW